MEPDRRPSAAEAAAHAWIRRHARGGGGGDDAPAPPRAAAAATAAPAATAIDDPAVLGAVARRMARFVAMGKLKRLALNVLARASVRKATFKILPLGKGTTAPSSSSYVTSGVQLRSRPCGPLQETVNCSCPRRQELSGPELTQLRDVFREIDTDGSGTISTAELRRALEPHVAHRADSGGLEAGDRDAAQSLMEAADVSGDQQIDYREFIAATMQRQLYLREENVRKVFEHLDVDDSGDISVENLVALTGSKKKAEELIGEGDLDHSKTISYEEFKKLMHTAS